MPDIIPFKRSSRLIHDIDAYLDRCGEAVLLLEAAVIEYFEAASGELLQERVARARANEEKADELRRDIANTMYSEMLMPDTRGDVLELLDAIDGGLDASVHLLVRLDIERPDIPEAYRASGQALIREVSAAFQTMLSAGRIYFTNPGAVRGEVHKIAFHVKEATDIGLRQGREISDSDLPLERQQQLINLLAAVRALAADADDIADRLVIFALKRLG